MAKVYCFQSCSWSGLHAHQAIRDSLEGFEDRVEPGPAFGIQDLHEVQAHGFCDHGERRHKEHKLQPIN